MANMTHTQNGYGFRSNDVIIITSKTVPTANTGKGDAGKGSLCLCEADGKAYVNGGTKATPAWKIITSA